MSVVKQAVPGMGADVNQPLSFPQAVAFKSSGYDTIIRYIPRTSALSEGNLTPMEINDLLNAGLNVGAVQHCPLPGWDPSAELGEVYGKYCAEYCKDILLPLGMNIWLDLETPSSAATAQECIDYAKAWYTAVDAAGYLPGLYIGYGVPLTSSQLYNSLPYKAYWKAYNYDDGVAVRGFMIEQQTQKTLQGVPLDPNKIMADHLGSLPMFLSPT